MNACLACERAEGNPHSGIFMTGCKPCEARRLALSPMAHRAMLGDRDQLLAAIADVWKDDPDAGRKLVWHWMQRINNSNA